MTNERFDVAGPWAGELFISVHIFWDTPVLRVAIAPGVSWAWGDSSSFLSAVPWLVTLSRHKNWVFLISGALIGGNFLYVYRLAPPMQARVGACPTDAPLACNSASGMSRIVLWISGGIYCAGFFSAMCSAHCS